MTARRPEHADAAGRVGEQERTVVHVAHDSGWFLNARFGRFLLSPPESHERFVEEAIERGKAYADAGADGYFVPGLTDPTLVARVVASVPVPVNVMIADRALPLAPFADAGVARISRGPGLVRDVQRCLADALAVSAG